MKLTELFESSPIDIHNNDRSREGFDRMAAGAPKHASFCFGRMNPPTLGHRALLEKTKESAMGGEYYVFISKSHDKKDNPLPYAEKLSFIDEMFPDIAQHIVRDETIKTPLLAAKWLYEKGIRAMTMVAGGDRLPGYEQLLAKWNSKEVRDAAGRDEVIINFVSSGDREDGADDLTGISATSARTAAKEGNIKTFLDTTGTSGDLAKRLYTAVRRGMGLEDTAIKESEGSVRLKDVATIGTGLKDADFYINLRGSDITVGAVSKEHGPYKCGVKVTRTDVVIPQYLYYMLMDLHARGYFKRLATGATNLVNIRISDIANIKLGG